MRGFRKLIVGAVAAACVSGAVLMAEGTVSLAVTETYQSAIEATYGEIFHRANDNHISGSPLESDSPDGVDTATGHLILSRTDLSLEGTGGMDFELNRYYDSNDADLGHTTVEYLDKLERDTVWVNYTAEDGSSRRIIVSTAVLNNHKSALKTLVSSYSEGDVRKQDPELETQRTKVISNRGYDVYGVASGWRYDFPWIETVTIKDNVGWSERPAYLHFGSAGTMAIQTTADSSAHTYSITGLDYGYQDIKLQDWDKTVDNIPVRYLLRDKTGLRTYFNADGVVVLQKDAHNNTITFTYTDKIYFNTITDSVGRKIVFRYNGSGEEKVLSSVTVQGQKAEGGVSEKTVTYETEERNYAPLYGDRLSGYTLTGAKVDGSKESYTYKATEHLVNTCGAGVASQRVSTNQSYLLTKVAADGGETHYEYRACSMRGQKTGSGDDFRDAVTEQFYVTREYEKDSSTGKKSNGVKYDYFQKLGTKFLSYADFRERESTDEGGDGIIYEISPYGTSGLKTLTVVSSFNPNKYKTNGKYYDDKYKKSKIDTGTLKLKKDTKKSVDLYVYNENKQLTEEVNYGKEKQETVNSYSGSLLALEITKSYGKKGSKAVVTKHGYTYDNYRNVLTSIGPKAYLKKNSSVMVKHFCNIYG